jgi:ABC-type transport system involved in multi-copper enzyme maturation permease subunit
MWLGAIAAAREIVKERAVFLRERAVGVSVRSYLLSKVVVLFLLTAAQTLILTAVLFGLRPLHSSTTAYLEVVVILLLTGLAAVGLGLLASTMARSEDQATSFIPAMLIPQLLFGGSIIPLVGKGLAIKVLSAIMVARWAFAGLGAADRLGQSVPVVDRYGGLFGDPVLEFIGIVAGFAALFLVFVGVRLARQSA